jgi:imidazolonepropionase-like amidohydrolase
MKARLFAGGRVFDGERMLAEGTGVLVEHGRIVRVAPLAALATIDAERLDTTGCTLLPGLVDCHVHLCSTCDPGFFATILSTPKEQASLLVLQMAQETLRGGVTTVRDLGGYEFVEMQVRELFRRGAALGPTLVCAGKSITTTGGHAWSLSFEADDAGATVAAVRGNIERGAEVIKLIATGGIATPGVDPLAASMSVAALAAASSEAHARGLRVAVHAQGAPGIHNALDARADSIEHGFEITAELAARMVEAGVYLVPTLSAIARTLETAEGRMPAHMIEKSLRFREMQQASFRRFVAAGGRVAMGTDAGTPFNYHGRNAQELAEMCALGLPVTAALHAATVQAAELLGLADRGRIRDGFAADLLLVEGDAGTDVRCVAESARHRLVLKDGFDVHRLLGRPGALPTSPRFVAGEAPY